MRLVLHHAKGDVYSLQLITPFSSCLSEESKNVTITISLKTPYSGKLSREKTFTNFTVLWLFAKVIPVKFGGMASFGTAKASNPRKFSPQKLYFLPIRKSFLPQQKKSLPLYDKQNNKLHTMWLVVRMSGDIFVLVRK